MFVRPPVRHIKMQPGHPIRAEGSESCWDQGQARDMVSRVHQVCARIGDEKDNREIKRENYINVYEYLIEQDLKLCFGLFVSMNTASICFDYA